MTTSFLASPTPLIRLRSSGKDIVAAGTVHTFSPDHLEINLADLQITFEFKSDSNGVRIEAETLSPKSTRVRLYNFNNSIGTGTTHPLEIGVYQHRTMFIAFTVYAFDDKSLKTVHYTFFLGEVKHE